MSRYGKLLQSLDDDDELFEDMARDDTGAKKDHLVILLHGILSRAEWYSIVGSELQRDSRLLVRRPKYGKYGPQRLLFPLDAVNGYPLRVLRNAYQDGLHDNRFSQVSVVAHSFGTHVLTTLLEAHDVTLECVILIGGVVRPNFPWRDVEQRIQPRKAGAAKVYNFRSANDPWPAAARALPKLGDSGRNGFHDDLEYLEDRECGLGHTGYFTNRFAAQHLRRILIDR